MSQRTRPNEFCKNHETQVGNYYISEQPWVKFCSECALNMALYGKKINRELSSEEYENKSKTEAITQRIKSTLSQIEVGKNLIVELAAKVETHTKSQIADIVRRFDQYVKNLIDVREEVVDLFESTFPQSTQSYFERQTKILLAQIDLKKSLNYIEANYTQLIENKGEDRLQDKMQHWGKVLADVAKTLPKESEERQLDEFIGQRLKQLKQKISGIQPLSEVLGQKNCKYLTKKQKQLQFLTTIQPKENRRNTLLKLRSRSKQSSNNQSRDSISTNARKSIKDITNSLQFLQNFPI